MIDGQVMTSESAKYSIYETDQIDPAIIKIFAAFAVDYQEHFKADL